MGSIKRWDKIEKFGDPLRLQVQEFEVDPGSTALLIIDVQKYGCRPDMALGKLLVDTDPKAADYWFSRLESLIIPNIRKLLEFFRNNKLIVTRKGRGITSIQDLVGKKVGTPIPFQPLRALPERRRRQDDGAQG